MTTKRKEHVRHSARITRGPHKRLECDHIKPVRTHPELAYTLTNLQILCGACHTRKTRIEVGHKPLTPKRQQWRDLLRDMQRNPSSIGDKTC